MRQITISDVRRRIRGIKDKAYNKNATPMMEAAQKTAATCKRPADIIRLIETMTKSNCDIPFRYYLGLYEALIECGTVSDVSKMGTFIAENLVHRTRDASELSTLIKQRLSKTSNKIKNKINRVFETLKDPIKDALTPSFNTTIVPTEDRYKSPLQYNPEAEAYEAKQEVAFQAYSKMLIEAIVMHHCDRVISNYDNISKRFNLEILFNENTRLNGVGDTVIELCDRIDTYNMPTDVKFNTVIETAWYGFESNCIEYTRSEILEASADYFAFKKDGLAACRSVLEATVFFDKNEDTKGIEILTEEEPEEEKDPSLSESVMAFCVKPVSEANDNPTTVDFDKIFADFKKNEIKDNEDSNKLKTLINKLYSRSASGIIEGTPKLMTWIRSFFIIGAATVPIIGPAVSIISYIADRFISLGMERKQVAEMITCFNKEIDATNNKIKSTKDEETRIKLEKYRDALKDGVDKISTYYENLFDVNEEHQDPSSIGREGKEDDDDYDFLGEQVAFDKLATLTEELYEYIVARNNIITETGIYNLIRFGNIDNDNITDIATVTSLFPDTFHKDSVTRALKDLIEDVGIGNKKFDTLMDKYLTTDILKQALKKVNDAKEPSEQEVFDIDEIAAVFEAYSAINILINAHKENHTDTPFLEASFMNTLRLASMKLKNAMTKMSDKERKASQSIDVALNNFTKGVERSLTNDSREAVIKGSILPSASKVLKLGLVSAGLGFLTHGIAVPVITVLGYLGCSAKYKAKERQMIIDEIEIEQKICQKYIDVAEQKNDMKALRELLSIQRNLERQHQRIKYKMKVDFGQKYYDAKAPN